MQITAVIFLVSMVEETNVSHTHTHTPANLCCLSSDKSLIHKVPLTQTN